MPKVPERFGLEPGAVTSEVLAHAMQILREDVADVKGAVAKLTEAVSRLALLEERQQDAMGEVRKVYSELSSHNARLMEIERKLPMLVRSSDAAHVWFDRAVLAALSVLGTHAAHVAGLM